MSLSSNSSTPDFDLQDGGNASKSDVDNYAKPLNAKEYLRAKLAAIPAAPLKSQIEIDLDRELSILHRETIANEDNQRAHISYDLQDYPAALGSIDRAIQSNSERIDFYYQRALIAKALNNYPQVLADCQEILNRDPQNQAAWRLKAIALVRTKNYEVALASFARHIELHPQDPHGYCYRGICYAKLKDHHRALADFNIALELKPGEPIFHHARGGTYQQLGNFSAALADYDLVIQSTTILRKVYDDRAEIYRLQGNYPNAIADCTQAIAYNPDRIDAYFRRGIIYAELGNFDLALADYDRIISLDRHHVRTYLQRSWVYFRQNKYLLAGEDCESILKIDRDCFWSNYLLGVINTQSGLKDRALANFIRAIEICPNDISAHYHRGLIYHELGNAIAANADFIQARSIQDRTLEEAVVGMSSTLENRDETGFYAEALALHYTGQKELAITILKLALLVAKRFNNDSFQAQILVLLRQLLAD
jgi:tetratricopeptide (TPR) repeat protein